MARAASRAVHRPGGGHPAAEVRAVDQVVVHERGHVHELHGHSRGERGLAAGRGREEDEQRAQPLAARGERLVADRRDETGMARDGAREALLERVEVLLEPGGLADGGQRRSLSVVTAPPPRARPRYPLQTGETAPFRSRRRPSSAARSSGSGKRRTLAGRYVYAEPPGRTRPSSRDDPVEPDAVEGRERAARRRDLEDPEPAAGAQHAAQLPQPRLEIVDVAHAEADRRRVEGRVRERQREHVAAHPFDRRRLAARPLEHPLGEVEPRDCAAVPARLEREVAGSAAGVEHPVARPHDLLDGDPAPAPVEAHGHEPVHQVVDRRDPVEHALDAVGREAAGLDGHVLRGRIRMTPVSSGRAGRRDAASSVAPVAKATSAPCVLASHSPITTSLRASS